MKVIGIGASAGGLEAISDFLMHLPPEAKRWALVVAQHLSPSHKSMLVQLLSKQSKLKVTEAINGLRLTKGMVYITPPDNNIRIESGGIILLEQPATTQFPKPSVDTLFESLANTYGKDAIGVILSGTGSDGSKGAIKIKQSGGLLFVQKPSEAKHSGMPNAAIETGVVDAVLPASKISDAIAGRIEFQSKSSNPNQDIQGELLVQNEADALNIIFKILSEAYGTNFANYKQSTIMRRIEKRMADLKLHSINEYVAYLQANKNEIYTLYNHFLIGVTAFFRDREAFEALEKVLANVVNKKGLDEKIRVWVPGCATGEEAYTIAIILYRLTAARNMPPGSVQIFATDIDDQALRTARKGIYNQKSCAYLPPDVLETYFRKLDNDRFEVTKSIRTMVLFSRQDITLHPPFLNLDLISCRNLLIYFTPELQEHIFPIFHYALHEHGILFLGKSESIGNAENQFQTIDAKNRIFRRIGTPVQSKISPAGISVQRKRLLEPEIRSTSYNFQAKLKDALLEALDMPLIVINTKADIVYLNGDVSSMLTLPKGQMQTHLFRLIRPELQIEVRSLVTKAIKENQAQKSALRLLKTDSERFWYRLLIRPLEHVFALEKHFLILFDKIDVELLDALQEKATLPVDVDNADAHIRALEEELQMTKQHLQTYIEEIETTNEELQTLNEELQSTNEELQSSVEELETGNEELQSTNEELQIAYTELQSALDAMTVKDKTIQELNQRFQTVIDNTSIGFMLIQKNYAIQFINTQAQLLLDKVGTHSVSVHQSALDVFPKGWTDAVLALLKEAFEGNKTLLRKIFDGDEKTEHVAFEITCAPIQHGAGTDETLALLTLRDVSAEEHYKRELRSKNAYLNSLVRSSTTYIIRTDMEGKYTFVNEAFCQKFGLVAEDVLGKPFQFSVHPDDEDLCNRAAYDAITNPGKVIPVEIRKPNPNGGYFYTYWDFVAITNDIGQVVEIQCVGHDITEKRITQQRVEAERAKLSAILSITDIPMLILSEPSRHVIYSNEAARILLAETEAALQRHTIYHYILKQTDKDSIDLDLLENKPVQNKEITLKTTDGRLREVLCNAMPFDYLGQKALYLSLYDITELKKQQEEYRFNAEMLANVSDALVATDLQGKVIYYNHGAEAIYGYTAAEMMGRTLDILFPDQDMEAYKAQLNDILRGNDYIGEWKGRNKWGQEFYVYIRTTVFRNSDGHIVGFVGMAKDITTLKKQELKLRQSAYELERLSENIPGVIYKFRMRPDGKMDFPYVSKGIELLHPGLTPEALQANAQLAFVNIHPADLINVTKSIVESARALSVWKNEYRVVRDGQEYWHRGIAMPEREPDGSVVWYGFFQDVTQEKVKSNLVQDTLNRFISFSNNSGLLFYIHDQTGKIVYANDDFSNLVTLRKSAVGLKIDQIFEYQFDTHFQDLNRFLLVEGQKFKTEVKYTSEDHELYFLISKFPINSDSATSDAKYYGGVCQDITQSMHQEIELMLREQRLSSIINSGSHFIKRINLNLEYTFVNKAYETVFGLPLEKLIGTDTLQFVHPEDRPEVRAYLNRLVEIVTPGESHIIRKIDKNGKTLLVKWEYLPIFDQNHKIIEIQAVGWDVTEFEHQKQELEKLALVAKKTKNAVIIANAEGLLEWANDGFTRITGYEVSEVIGKKPGSVLQGKDTDPETVKMISDKLKRGEGFYAEILNYRKTGEPYWINIEAEPIFDEQGRVQKIVAIETEITEKKEKEQERQRLVEDLMVKNKNLEEFSYIISHNLRGPVANLLGLAELAELDNSPEMQREIAQSFQKTARQLDEVLRDVNKIITYRNNLNETKSWVFIHELLQNVLESLEKELKGVDYEIINHVDPELRIYTIKGFLHSILYNLISNAIKYRKINHKLNIIITAAWADGFVDLAVHDNGLGIDLQKYKDGMFMLYKRFHQHVSGKGLGLFMTKQQVQMLGGTIDVKSKVGQGTSFIIRLPIK